MKKISNTKNALVQHLPFSYFSLPLYLDFVAYTFKRNNENLLVSQDAVYPHEFPSLFLPQNPLNWENCSITFARKEDVNRLREHKIEILIEKALEFEYYYPTQQFTQPSGSFGKKIRAFQKKYHFTILEHYDRSGIEAFYQEWKKQKQAHSFTFDESEQFYQFCLKQLDHYPIAQIYIEINNKLAGFAWGIKHPNGGWVGLHLKVNYAYQGLSRYLHHERAKRFEGIDQFSLGTGSFEKGIGDYKEELHPSSKVQYAYVLTGGKIK